MKIMVFDDNATHRAAAKAQLNGHDVTVVGTYDEAQSLLKPKLDSDRAHDIFAAKYGDRKPYTSEGISKEARQERMDYYNLAEKQATTYPDFDAVLTDLLVPASDQAQGRGSLAGEEMPVGIFIGLLAAAKTGAKYVAVFTDSSHHDHPASACFDAFNAGEVRPTPFTLNESRVLLSNTRNWVNEFDPADLSKKLEYTEYSERKDTVRAKNWAAVLDYLVNYDDTHKEDGGPK